MKKYIRKVLFTFLLLAGLPVVSASCNLLVLDNNNNSQTDGASCLEGVLAIYIYPAQLCYERLAKQKAGVEQPELLHPVSQSECDEKLLLSLLAYKYQCVDESNK